MANFCELKLKEKRANEIYELRVKKELENTFYELKMKDELVNEFWRAWSLNEERLSNCCRKWLKGHLDKVDDALSVTREKSYLFIKDKSPEIDNLYSFVCRTAYHVCMDILRQHKRDNSLITKVRHLNGNVYFSEGVSEVLEDQLVREQRIINLSECWSTLPENLQEILKYRFINELDYPEIATLLSLSQSNVRKRVQLAREKLREAS
ncbi:sigma-70 family RNA polymerase sigma factor [Shewanella sp. D64]|uniref:RNA polymerase sigma factor n=1 Tax=unclassified Shewanella TaxID=196818 RepID=UPI0022BA4809|nr:MULTISPECIES: sigma-70 family RNA polymerase sigma factor [unclassified Shewanella]MEC4725815.1 sigma-70 family RNA polymerase sigma factor [Shewanella sp. D64]MEC4737578.1 sigma-70 family RNA polymerase sigma factor [Shewanella sp. E94]WBJ93396.1 sigma-70 family RNA polymerase sigma factor [Shewanella sp. MTB7]